MPVAPGHVQKGTSPSYQPQPTIPTHKEGHNQNTPSPAKVPAFQDRIDGILAKAQKVPAPNVRTEPNGRDVASPTTAPAAPIAKMSVSDKVERMLAGIRGTGPGVNTNPVSPSVNPQQNPAPAVADTSVKLIQMPNLPWVDPGPLYGQGNNAKSVAAGSTGSMYLAPTTYLWLESPKPLPPNASAADKAQFDKEQADAVRKTKTDPAHYFIDSKGQVLYDSSGRGGKGTVLVAAAKNSGDKTAADAARQKEAGQIAKAQIGMESAETLAKSTKDLLELRARDLREMKQAAQKLIAQAAIAGKITQAEALAKIKAVNRSIDPHLELLEREIGLAEKADKALGFLGPILDGIEIGSKVANALPGEKQRVAVEEITGAAVKLLVTKAVEGVILASELAATAESGVGGAVIAGLTIGLSNQAGEIAGEVAKGLVREGYRLYDLWESAARSAHATPISQ